jgi:hypothetical protein
MLGAFACLKIISATHPLPKVLEALSQVLDEAPALEKARRIKLRLEGQSDE